MAEKLLTNKEAARLLGIHPHTLKNWKDQGLVPEPKRIGKREYYTESQLDKITKG